MESPCTTAIRSDSTSSPEFEFWILQNPFFPQPNLYSANELFVDDVLLSLHLLPSKPDPPPNLEQLTTSRDPNSSSSFAMITKSSTFTTTLSTSKRWKKIFKKKNTKNNNIEEKKKWKAKEKKKEIKKTGSGSGSAAELNINIWSFSRSRSTRNAVTRPKLLFRASSSTRKVNNVPCSQSNPTRDSKSKKWSSNPSRPGVHVSQTSPVWQVHRTKNSNNTDAQDNDSVEAKKKESTTCQRRGTKARVLNLNIPMCIGYRQHLSCRCDKNGGA